MYALDSDMGYAVCYIRACFSAVIGSVIDGRFILFAVCWAGCYAIFCTKRLFDAYSVSSYRKHTGDMMFDHTWTLLDVHSLNTTFLLIFF